MLEEFAEELLAKPDAAQELVKANAQLKLLNERMSTQESLLTNIRAYLEELLAAVKKGEKAR